MATRVVHCRRSKYDVYIGRPSKWGNPFKLGTDGDRTAVLQRYRKWLLEQKELLAQLSELTGKTLACWCKPLSCHGDILAELADQIPLIPSPGNKPGSKAAKRRRKTA
jgi:Domain of unknown function (DUF4326)